MRHRKRREDDPYGYDTDAINALAFVEGGGSLSTVERFLTSAHQQVSAILREAKSHRELQRIRSARAEALRIIGDLESADAGEHARAAAALDKIVRYERRVRSRQPKALRDSATRCRLPSPRKRLWRNPRWW